MSTEIALLRREVRALQGELLLLRERVDRQEERIAELESFELVEPAEESAPPDQGRQATSSAASGSASSTRPANSGVDWNLRLQVAKEIAGFLRANLAGERTGTSSRSRIPLRSTIYVPVRDRHRRVTTELVRVFRSWKGFKNLVEDGQGSLGDCIFVGLPSQKQAQVAVIEAGFTWPDRLELLAPQVRTRLATSVATSSFVGDGQTFTTAAVLSLAPQLGRPLR